MSMGSKLSHPKLGRELLKRATVNAHVFLVSSVMSQLAIY